MIVKRNDCNWQGMKLEEKLKIVCLSILIYTLDGRPNGNEKNVYYFF